MSTQLAIKEPNGSDLVQQRPSMSRILEMAMSQDVDANKLEKMMEMQFRWQKEESRLAYITAIQQFKANPPILEKTKTVSFATSNGRTEYTHVELHKANKIVSEALRAVGITASWKMSSDPTGRTFCTCILTHAMGHVEEVSTLSAPADTSGAKNAVQAIGSTSKYLMRYTMLAGTGLTPEDVDDDGRTSESLPEKTVDEFITSIRDASDFNELKQRYEAAKAAANKVNDHRLAGTFQEEANKRQKDLRAKR